MARKAILVFTGKTIEHMLKYGGSSAWVLDQIRARQYEFIVCTRNSHASFTRPGPEEHGSAFLIGRIGDVVSAPGEEGRFLITFREYARVAIPGVWQGWRNPVRYTTLEDVGINPDTLTFEPLPEAPARPTALQAATTGRIDARPLTISEAKRGLAKAFGVSEDAVEITVHG